MEVKEETVESIRIWQRNPAHPLFFNIGPYGPRSHTLTQYFVGLEEPTLFGTVTDTNLSKNDVVTTEYI